jgi:hypothetical protein
MKHLQSGIVQLYARLLHLYPPQFRAEFADEMHAVFTEAISETNDLWSLLGLCLGEVRDLPLSVIRQHLKERKAYSLEFVSEHRMPSKPVPVRTVRFCIWTLLATAALYGLIIQTPFFVLKLNTLSSAAIRSGMYDPKGYFPFDNNFVGWLAQWLGMWAVIIGPIWLMGFGGILLLNLRRYWKQLVYRQRLMGSIAVAASLMTIILMFSPLGLNALAWFMD